MFADKEQFALPFQEVAALGIHSGKHGFMIENVSDFVVEIFNELAPDAFADVTEDPSSH